MVVRKLMKHDRRPFERWAIVMKSHRNMISYKEYYNSYNVLAWNIKNKKYDSWDSEDKYV